MIAALAALAALAAAAPEPAPFEVLRSDADFRTVTLGYETGPCYFDEDVTVVEERRSIRIAFTRTFAEGCAAPSTWATIAVRLRRPIAGRAITGPARVAPGSVLFRPSRIPEVLDLAAADAERALRAQGFTPKRLGRERGAVAFQSPLPKRRAGDRRVVRLTVGRGLFRRRALDRCLESAGIPTRPRVPKPGDADAPDLVLWLRHPSAMASVALYADPVRARELAPTIRRTVRGLGGVLERGRHFTFAWYDPPAAGLRAAAHRCVDGPLGRPRL